MKHSLPRWVCLGAACAASWLMLGPSPVQAIEPRPAAGIVKQINVSENKVIVKRSKLGTVEEFTWDDETVFTDTRRRIDASKIKPGSKIGLIFSDLGSKRLAHKIQLQ